jgi:hypothetical protein
MIGFAVAPILDRRAHRDLKVDIAEPEEGLEAAGQSASIR